MSFPSPDAHKAQTGRGLEVQTDKEKFKIVPCTYAGCTTDLVVNVFYAPYKGKCSLHNGSGGTAAAKAVSTSHLLHVAEDGERTPNGALGDLLCPLCRYPLLIRNVSEDGIFITFVCAEGLASTRADVEAGMKACGTAIQIRLNYKAMTMRSFPTAYAKLIEQFNLDQAIGYFDEKEVRDEAKQK